MSMPADDEGTYNQDTKQNSDTKIRALRPRRIPRTREAQAKAGADSDRSGRCGERIFVVAGDRVMAVRTQ
jgi:hypothetical protein